jgi:hypothetical protein
MAILLVRVPHIIVMLVASAIIAEAVQQHVPLADQLIARGVFGVLSVENKLRLEQEP